MRKNGEGEKEEIENEPASKISSLNYIVSVGTFVLGQGTSRYNCNSFWSKIRVHPHSRERKGERYEKGKIMEKKDRKKIVKFCRVRYRKCETRKASRARHEVKIRDTNITFRVRLVCFHATPYIIGTTAFQCLTSLGEPIEWQTEQFNVDSWRSINESIPWLNACRVFRLISRYDAFTELWGNSSTVDYLISDPCLTNLRLNWPHFRSKIVPC